MRKQNGTILLLMESLLILGLFVGVPTGIQAQTASGRAWVTDTINSRALGKRAMYVATPEGYDIGKARYPVLVLLDANDQSMFKLWIAQATYVADNSPGVPFMVVVGIPNGSDRIHDMTPPATGSSLKTFPTAGGAAAFADFILGEVLPYVRARYRTLPSVTLVGHSAAGLFAVDVTARRPEAFQGIIATDPSLQFNDGKLVDTYIDLIGRSKSPPRLFVSNRGGDGVLAVSANRFAKLLSANASFAGTFSHRVYPDATHSLVPLSFADGLRFVFEPMSPEHLALSRLDLARVDSATLNEALRSSEIVFAAAARSLGLAEQLPEQILNGLGYDLLGEKKVDLAIAVFKRNIRLYPESVNVYDSYADGLIAAGDTTSAIAELQTAVKVAKRTGAPVPEETQRKLEGLEAKR